MRKNGGEPPLMCVAENTGIYFNAFDLLLSDFMHMELYYEKKLAINFDPTNPALSGSF